MNAVFPPGHLPGFHFPGTLVPMGVVAQMQQQAVAMQAAAYAAAQRQEEIWWRPEEQEEAKQAVQREREAVQSVAAGFPWNEAGGLELSAVLERLVPGRKQRFEAGRKSLGRTVYLVGWGFELGVRTDRNSVVSVRRHGLVVTPNGGLHPYAWPLDARPWSQPYRPGRINRINSRDLRQVRKQVLAWMGKDLSDTASPRQHYLAELSADGAAPPFEVWIRDWPG